MDTTNAQTHRLTRRRFDQMSGITARTKSTTGTTSNNVSE
jgi:hypothetical protein